MSVAGLFNSQNILNPVYDIHCDSLTANNISASGSITVSSLTTTGNITTSGDIFANNITLSPSGFITTPGTIQAQTLFLSGNLTTIGNIQTQNLFLSGGITTAGGNITTTNGYVTGRILVGGALSLTSGSIGSLTNISLGPGLDVLGHMTVSGNLTTIGNITASGSITTTGNITASGNLSVVSAGAVGVNTTYFSSNISRLYYVINQVNVQSNIIASMTLPSTILNNVFEIAYNAGAITINFTLPNLSDVFTSLPWLRTSSYVGYSFPIEFRNYSNNTNCYVLQSADAKFTISNQSGLTTNQKKISYSNVAETVISNVFYCKIVNVDVGTESIILY